MTLMNDHFCVSSGVRQGGVVSPLLFAVYVDDLIAKLRCYGCIFHADDIALLSCSCYGLQTLLDICSAYGEKWDINLTRKKAVLAQLVATIPLPRLN